MKSLKVFIETPNHQNYSRIGLAMRRDLYRRKTKLEPDDIKIDSALDHSPVKGEQSVQEVTPLPHHTIS